MKNLNNTSGAPEEQNIFDMLFGCLLGDAHIGVYGTDKVYITFEQTIKHKDYVLHIYDVLSGVDGIELSSRPPLPFPSLRGALGVSPSAAYQQQSPPLRRRKQVKYLDKFPPAGPHRSRAMGSRPLPPQPPEGVGGGGGPAPS
jgi:hypothetical protein